MTATRRGTLTITGIGAERARTAPRAVARTATAMGVAGAMLALAGCTTVPDEGVVTRGADGEDYVLADGTERPVYRTREDCIADVSDQIAKLQAEGETVPNTAEELCESSEPYGHAYGGGLVWLGPLLFAGSRWNSSRVSSWAPVPAGGFAAAGAAAQPDVTPPAASGAKVGSRAPLAGGFGSSGKGTGFGSSAKSSSNSHGSFGG